MTSCVVIRVSRGSSAGLTIGGSQVSITQDWHVSRRHPECHRARPPEEAREILRKCRLCPRACLANRLEGELGDCGVGAKPMVSTFYPHFGEEDPLVGWGRSGTIFLTSCNLRCVFCQNFEISHRMEGDEVEAGDVAAMMVRLQAVGCHNINFVTPTHQVPQILEALALAMPGGLCVHPHPQSVWSAAQELHIRRHPMACQQSWTEMVGTHTFRRIGIPDDPLTSCFVAHHRNEKPRSPSVLGLGRCAI